MPGIDYKQAGVDRDRGESAKSRIRALAQSTFDARVLKNIGLFGGFYSLDGDRYQEPVLVSSIDGVGTKIKIAQLTGKYDSIGEDLVNHCVNDIMVCGAEPAFFLDYIAADRMEPQVMVQLVDGMARACKNTGCALIGGETAEMPGVYAAGNFDVVGCMVGVVEKAAIIDGSAVKAGDVLLGVPSSGLHTNGFSLVRKVLLEMRGYSMEKYLPELDCSLGEELLKTHRSYQPLIQEIRGLAGVHALSHVTGGGLVENTLRVIPDGLGLSINWSAWEAPPIFRLVAEQGGIAEDEMRRVFNLGIGLVVVIDKNHVDDVRKAAEAVNQPTYEIGEVIRKK